MNLIRLETVDSTNDAAKRLIADGSLSENVIVIAREQTVGRGTHGRSWLSPRDAGLYFSIVTLDAGPATPDLTTHTLAAGVACAETLIAATGLEIRLKPINDLIAGGGKLGGILVESLVESGRVRALITGIGINTHDADRPLPPDALPAVSLQQLLPAAVFNELNLSELTNGIVDAVRRWQHLVTSGNVETVQRRWQSLCV
ncbi:MAG: hypothetical protein AMXMBFR20_08160 [Planctomycetia bacterium]